MAENRLLSSLPADLRRSLEPDLITVDLELRTEVGNRGTSLEHVYFPTTCLVSVVVDYEDGRMIEVTLIGNDGCTGTSILLSQNASHHDMIVQVAGGAQKMAMADFLRHLGDSRFRDALGAYGVKLFAIIGQLAGCIAFHPVEQRLARWLLMVRDRLGTDDIPLTHEFIGVMLGVNRPTVTLSIHALENAGLVKAHRGRISIIHPIDLEEAACECYTAIRGLNEV